MDVPRSSHFLVPAAVVVSAALLPSINVHADDRGADRTTVAVIGDVPYGEDQEASFGTLIAAVNDDPKVRTVVHVGDTKSGSTACTDERLTAVRDAFETFEDPVVYTPGDNEWTDCHRPAAGGYDPLERLAIVRSLYFAEPGSTLGRPAEPGQRPAGARRERPLGPVEGRVRDAARRRQQQRTGAMDRPAPHRPRRRPPRSAPASTPPLAWIDATFDTAEADGLAGVVLAMQADTFPTPGSGQQAIVERIADARRCVHGRGADRAGRLPPLPRRPPLPLDNVTRIVVHGETLPFEYLRLTIDPRATSLFSWERVPVDVT